MKLRVWWSDGLQVTAAEHSDPYFVALHLAGVEKEFVRVDFGALL